MREYNFFWSFKMAIKNSFFVVRSVKIVKSIGDNFKINAYLFFEVYAKKPFFWTFFTNLIKNT
jgi:hypothetical protein